MTDVVVSMATIPARAESCDKAIASLAAQTRRPTRILVEMNGFSPEEFEFRKRWLEKTPRVFVPRKDLRVEGTHDRGDDAMKFLYDFAESAARPVAVLPPVWRIVCDDDLVYPPDYIDTMIAAAEALGCPVSAHGVKLRLPLRSYYGSREVYHCVCRVFNARPVDVLGTGVLCYRSDWLDLSIEDFPLENMADTQLAVLMKRRKIPAYVVPHEAGWIQLANPNDTDTIWHASRRNDRSSKDTGVAQTALLKQNEDLFFAQED